MAKLIVIVALLLQLSPTTEAECQKGMGDETSLLQTKQEVKAAADRSEAEEKPLNERDVLAAKANVRKDAQWATEPVSLLEVSAEAEDKAEKEPASLLQEGSNDDTQLPGVPFGGPLGPRSWAGARRFTGMPMGMGPRGTVPLQGAYSVWKAAHGMPVSPVEGAMAKRAVARKELWDRRAMRQYMLYSRRRFGEIKWMNPWHEGPHPWGWVTKADQALAGARMVKDVQTRRAVGAWNMARGAQAADMAANVDADRLEGAAYARSAMGDDVAMAAMAEGYPDGAALRARAAAVGGSPWAAGGLAEEDEMVGGGLGARAAAFGGGMGERAAMMGQGRAAAFGAGIGERAAMLGPAIGERAAAFGESIGERAAMGAMGMGAGLGAGAAFGGGLGGGLGARAAFGGGLGGLGTEMAVDRAATADAAFGAGPVGDRLGMGGLGLEGLGGLGGGLVADKIKLAAMDKIQGDEEGPGGFGLGAGLAAANGGGFGGGKLGAMAAMGGMEGMEGMDAEGMEGMEGMEATEFVSNGATPTRIELPAVDLSSRGSEATVTAVETKDATEQLRDHALEATWLEAKLDADKAALKAAALEDYEEVKHKDDKSQGATEARKKAVEEKNAQIQYYQKRIEADEAALDALKASVVQAHLM